MIDDLFTIVASIRGAPAPSDRDSIANILRENGAESPPQWVATFIRDIAHENDTPHLLRVPTEDGGLIEVLLDIDKSVHPLGIDDCGEMFQWPIPSLGVTVFICRETPSGYYHAAILRSDANVMAWFRAEYIRDREIKGWS